MSAGTRLPAARSSDGPRAARSPLPAVGSSLSDAHDRMKTARQTREILDKLEAQHPDADTELHYTTPFELLVATILSAQSTDARVNMVTPALFKRYPHARALAKATTAALEPQIHSTGFFRAKSKSLIGMARALVKDHGGAVPASMEALIEL